MILSNDILNSSLIRINAFEEGADIPVSLN